MGAACDQLRAKFDDPRIACGRAGFDDDERVGGLAPQPLGKCTTRGIADFADQVARDDEISG